MNSGQPFSRVFTDQFQKAVKKLEAGGIEKLRARLDEICSNPVDISDSHRLSHDWSGFRGVSFDARRRIIYRVCGECVMQHDQDQHPLPCCADAGSPLMVITFVDFGDYHYDAGRRRLVPQRYTIPDAE